MFFIVEKLLNESVPLSYISNYLAEVVGAH